MGVLPRAIEAVGQPLVVILTTVVNRNTHHASFMCSWRCLSAVNLGETLTVIVIFSTYMVYLVVGQTHEGSMPDNVVLLWK